MRRLVPALLLATLLAGLAAARPSEPGALSSTGDAILAEQPAEVRRKLEQHKRVLLDPTDNGDEPGEPFVRALVIFEQPPERAMRLLSQTARQTEFRPDLHRVETVARLEHGTIEEHRMKLLFVTVRYWLHNHFDFDARRIWWELEPGFENDLRAVDGYWELHPLGANRTLARFATRVDIGASLPRWIQVYATRKNVPRTLEFVRRWVDSDGTYRP